MNVAEILESAAKIVESNTRGFCCTAIGEVMMANGDFSNPREGEAYKFFRDLMKPPTVAYEPMPWWLGRGVGDDYVWEEDCGGLIFRAKKLRDAALEWRVAHQPKAAEAATTKEEKHGSTSEDCKSEPAHESEEVR